MWNHIKRWFRRESKAEQPSERPSAGASEYQFKWYEVGPDNPFPIRVLDVRSLTWQVVATTSDPKIAESFNLERHSDGQKYTDAQIEDSTMVGCNLTFPHNGAPLEGIIYKAPEMDVKWDIYIFDSVFLFVRSWTGQLKYRAFAEITDTEIRIRKIETSLDDIETAAQAVYFLIATHAMKRVLPHTIPREFPGEPEQIGLLSFSWYDNLACYATYDDITQIPIPRPQTG